MEGLNREARGAAGPGDFWGWLVALRAPTTPKIEESISPNTRKVLTDADHSFTLKKSCVACLQTDRHQIGLTDRHHRNSHSVKRTKSSRSY